MIKRFVYGREVAINSDESLPVITDTKTEKNYYRFVDVVGLLNTQAEEISQWKHRVSSLLWILGQFDKEKVKALMEELDGGDGV